MRTQPFAFLMKSPMSWLVALPLLMAGCGGIPLGQDVPAQSLHDLQLLSRYGIAIQTKAFSQTWRDGLEREIQARGLLNAQDVMLIQERKFQVGSSMAATLAALNFMPKAFGVSPRYAEVEVVIMGSGLYQARQDDEFFFHKGRLVGWHYTTMDNRSTSIHRSSQGRTFNLSDFQITPCHKLGDSPCSGFKVPKLADASVDASAAPGPAPVNTRQRRRQ